MSWYKMSTTKVFIVLLYLDSKINVFKLKANVWYTENWIEENYEGRKKW